MGRKKKNTRRMDFNILVEAWEVLRNDAIPKGYADGNGVLWGEYFAAMAAMVVQGRINIPSRVDK